MMVFMMFLFLFLSIIGLAVVSFNPSPTYGALSLILVAGSACGLLVSLGSPFLSLVLFLVYLGGMLVIFAYSVAFTNSAGVDDLDGFWGFYESVTGLAPLIMSCLSVFSVELESELLTVGVDFEVNDLLQGNVVNVAVLYSADVIFLLFGSLALLVSLFVVLVMVRGSVRGGLRAI